MKTNFAHVEERKERKEQLEKTMEAMNLAPDVKKQMQAKTGPARGRISQKQKAKTQ